MALHFDGEMGADFTRPIPGAAAISMAKHGLFRRTGMRECRAADGRRESRSLGVMGGGRRKIGGRHVLY
jgi:hypothetical protein